MTSEQTRPVDHQDRAASGPGRRERVAALLHTRPGRAVGLVVLAVAWLAAYQVNGPAWDGLLYGVLGMDRSARLTETLHFFGYDTVKITLMLSATA